MDTMTITYGTNHILFQYIRGVVFYENFAPIIYHIHGTGRVVNVSGAPPAQLINSRGKALSYFWSAVKTIELAALIGSLYLWCVMWCRRAPEKYSAFGWHLTCSIIYASHLSQWCGVMGLVIGWASSTSRVVCMVPDSVSECPTCHYQLII